MGKVSDILWGIAELGAAYMEEAAKSNSHNSKLPAEIREEYIKVSESFGTIKNATRDHDILAILNMGKGEDEDDYEDEDEDKNYYFENYYEDDYKENEERFIVDRTKTCYNDENKALEQKSCAFSEDIVTPENLYQWEEQKVYLGHLGKINCDDPDLRKAGVVILELDDEIVYIVRAIEVKLGGVAKQLSTLQGREKRGRVFDYINKNMEYIDVEVIYAESINECRNLENQLIKKYNPMWLQGRLN